MDLTHIAYCGVDCAACADYESGKCPDCRHSRWPDEGHRLLWAMRYFSLPGHGCLL